MLKICVQCKKNVPTLFLVIDSNDSAAHNYACLTFMLVWSWNDNDTSWSLVTCSFDKKVQELYNVLPFVHRMNTLIRTLSYSAAPYYNFVTHDYDDSSKFSFTISSALF